MRRRQLSTGQWSFLPPDLFPRYLVVNGDEGEPSTFKDRMLVERDPHQLIEGIIISAFAIQCNQAFIYLRGEFALGYDRLMQALADARAKGFFGTNILGSGFDLEIVVHRTGAYICGEETVRQSRSRASGACCGSRCFCDRRSYAKPPL
jgi:NADH-quinone oxidoreductase subunit F